MAEISRPAIKVINYVDSNQLKRDMSYSTADLSSAMMEQASLFAHYGVLAARASRQVDNIKMLLETREAQVYRAKRSEFDDAGEKITETKLEKIVATSSTIVDLKRALAKARQIEAEAKIAVEGLRHRRDMLIQQGLIQREELKGELTISKRKVADDEANDVRERIMNKIKENSEQ
jgi:hypothetical protein